MRYFDGVLVYVFHEGFEIKLWDIEFNEFLMEYSCMAALTLAMMVMRGFTFIGLSRHLDCTCMNHIET